MDNVWLENKEACQEAFSILCTLEYLIESVLEWRGRLENSVKLHKQAVLENYRWGWGGILYDTLKL